MQYNFMKKGYGKDGKVMNFKMLMQILFSAVYRGDLPHSVALLPVLYTQAENWRDKT